MRPGRGGLLGPTDLVAQFHERILRCRLPQPGEQVVLLVADVRADPGHQLADQEVKTRFIRVEALELLPRPLGLGMVLQFLGGDLVAVRQKLPHGQIRIGFLGDLMPHQLNHGLLPVHLALLAPRRQHLHLPKRSSTSR